MDRGNWPLKGDQAIWEIIMGKCAVFFSEYEMVYNSICHSNKGEVTGFLIMRHRQNLEHI